MSLISGPQLQAAKLAALSNLNIGMVNSITIEGIDLSEELSEEFDIEEDDGVPDKSITKHSRILGDAL
eukprot:CAMPEP_0205808394 /NCGR_PEP_ID=MMETSP0205-20121125/12338_1 /ASSEMBLY_ACC=CAM_ASM_000278 /TAXON_ID=36767 /ORGANISM="Euplotes focardii, Strain TN1" /LENGTH=67 /DNA_ID=CAMNT_0053084009 /DNA_START=122 /DNA_END=325 /DNA_ORIENTATION=-